MNLCLCAFIIRSLQLARVVVLLIIRMTIENSAKRKTREDCCCFAPRKKTWQACGAFGWGREGDGVIEMTGTFTRDAIDGVEGIWMRPSTQVVTLRFRRATPSSSGRNDTTSMTAEGTPVEGTLDWPEERASAEFRGRIFSEISASAAGSDTAIAVLTLEGKVGDVLQGAPERVGWVAGAEIRGTFCKEGTDGTVKGSWSARAPAIMLEPLPPGGMRINVGLLPDRMLAVEGTGPVGGRSAPGEGGPGSGSDPTMGSCCR